MTKVSPQLVKEIKELVISTLKIDDIAPENIDPAASLFDEGNAFQIDSVDALELVMALQKKYGVHIDDQNIGRFIIKDINTIANFIAEELEKKKN